MLTLEERVRNCLRNKIKNIEKYTFNTEGNSNPGDGFLGDVFFIKFTNPEDPNDELNLVMKTLRPFHRTIPIVNDFFDREIAFYGDVYPKFKRFLEKKLPQRQFDVMPEPFGSHTSSTTKFLLLKNLKVEGYETWHYRKPATMEYTKLLLEKFAQWHAYSYALRDQQPDVFAEVSTFRRDLWGELVSTTNLGKSFRLNYLKNVKYLEGHISEKTLDWFKNIIPNYRKILVTNIDPIDLEKYSAICHIDCWNNNFMFKSEVSTDGKDKKLKEVRLIDWQCATLSIPTFDLSHFLLGWSDKVQHSNLKQLLNFYYEQFSTFVRELGSDPEKMYPLEIFWEHWKKYSLRGFIIAPTMLSYSLAKNSDDLLNDKAEDGTQVLYPTVIEYVPVDLEEYKERLINLVNNYVASIM